MEEQKKKTITPKKPSYEELNNYVNDLMMENRNLRQGLNQIRDIQGKLPYLFKIIELKDVFPKEYREAAMKEITVIIPPFSEEKYEESMQKAKEMQETANNKESK